jgi:hypothetical protein
MTIYQEYYWPPVDFQAVSLNKDLGDEGRILFMDGTLFDGINNQISFISHGYSRSLSFTSTDVDNSAATFTVSGLQNGVPVSEDIVGGTAGITVFGEKAFDIVTSITTDVLAQNFTVGTGLVGYLPLISVDTAMHTATLNYAIQSIFPFFDNNTINYDLFRSLAKIPLLGRSYDDLIENTEYFNQVGTTVDVSTLFHEESVMTCYLFNITESIDTDFLRIIYLQVQ